MATSLADRFLDAVVTARLMLPSRRTGIVRERPIPEGHLRVLIALLITGVIHVEEGSLPPRALIDEQHCIKTSELMELLPPRKTSSDEANVKAEALFASLDWLAQREFIELRPVGTRRRAHVTRLTLDALGEWEDTPAPRWPHARQLVRDAVLLKRLSPAKLAILGHLAYEVCSDGCSRIMDPDSVEEVTGLSMRWVRRQLEDGTLGPEHGLAHWSFEVGAHGGEFFVRLCKPDDSEVAAKPRPRLHPTFINDMLSSTRSRPTAVAP